MIRNIKDAIDAKKHLKAGGTGWYITYYEAVSRNGRKAELLPDKTFKVTKEHGRVVLHSSEEFCPGCDEPAQHGQWKPGRGICYRCGYRHRKLFVKPAYTHLTTAFKRGTIIIDEGTKIKSNTSLMSLSVRGLRARWRLLLTGTPIKNYINDAFWLLWWALGNNSVQFPYNYVGGYNNFMKEFAVVEYTLGSYGEKKGRPRVLPEVTNLSMLWRLLCCSIIRRRKEETGEVIVARKIIPLHCPVGKRQVKMYRAWLNGFALFFMDKYPWKTICDFPALVERNSAILGGLWKLAFATTLPEAEPDGYYDRGSNWTPANLKVLELATEHARAGEKVVIGSSLMAYGPWIAEQLNRHGINAVHVTEESKDGTLSTKSPAKRAAVVQDFRFNGTSVLCASIKSMMLGHNMECASVVILHGLPWDNSTYEQFIARVHRITSKRNVTVYVVMTDGTLDDRQWELITQKGAASDLAIDGELFEQDTEIMDLQKILDELKQRGISGEGAIPESQIFADWNSGPETAHEDQLSLLAI